MMTKALEDVIAERARQIAVEGWTEEHDDKQIPGSIARAAACYALQGSGYRGFVEGNVRLWPSNWDWRWWKSTTPRRDLVKAGALILAEIERIDRKEKLNG